MPVDMVPAETALQVLPVFLYTLIRTFWDLELVNLVFNINTIILSLFQIFIFLWLSLPLVTFSFFLGLQFSLVEDS